MVKPLFPHQRSAIIKAVPVLRERGGFYFYHKPGRGKTRTVITTLRLLGAQNILVVCPPVAVDTWRKEVRRWYSSATVHVLQDAAWSADLGSSASTPCFRVTNYEQLTGSDKLDVKTGRILAKSQAPARTKKLLAERFDALVFDESQYVKNVRSQRTRVGMRLARIRLTPHKWVKHRILMSGTPTHNVLDWYAQMKVVAPHEPMWVQTFGAFKRFVAVMGGPNGNWVTSFRPEAKRAVYAAIAPYIHISKGTKGIPPVVSEIEIPLSAAERKAYDQMELQQLVEIDGIEYMDASLVITKNLRLSQITSGHLQGLARIPSTKMKACIELIEQRPEYKICVAANFRWELDYLFDYYTKQGYPVQRIVGGTKNRGDIEDWFQKEDGPKILLLQYKAGGMSLTLTAMDTMIYYSMKPSVIDYEQMRGRFDRIGLDHQVEVLVLEGENTSDVDLYRGLESARTDDQLAAALLKGMRNRATTGLSQ